MRDLEIDYSPKLGDRRTINVPKEDLVTLTWKMIEEGWVCVHTQSRVIDLGDARFDRVLMTFEFCGEGAT